MVNTEEAVWVRTLYIVGLIVTAINIIGMPVAYALGLKHGRKAKRG